MKIEITGILMIYEEEILESRTSRQKTESKHSLRSEIPGKHKCRPDTYCIRQFENGAYYNDSLAVSSRYYALNLLALCQWSDNDQTLITLPKHIQEYYRNHSRFRTRKHLNV